MRVYLRLWWELLRLCARREPRLTACLLACDIIQALAFAGIGLALKAAVDGATSGGVTAATVGACGAAFAYAADGVVGRIGFTTRISLAERIALTEIEPRVMRACVGLERIEHLERTEFLDRITAVRGKSWAIVDSAWSAVRAVLLVLRVALALALLGSVSPWLLLLLPCVAIQLYVDRYGQRQLKRAELSVAEDLRLQRHLFEVCTSATSGKEIRVAGVGPELVDRQEKARQRVQERRFSVGIRAASYNAVGWAVFTLGFVGALLAVANRTASGEGSVGDVVMTVALASQLRTVVAQAVSTSVTAGSTAGVVETYAWLRAFAAERLARQTGDVPPPAVLRQGISLDQVTFRYPGTERPALDEVSVRLPAGAVVAVVGEYGSGKTTLVKLLTKLYQPDSGTIHIDGIDLRELDTTGWRSVMSAAFQDFGRYETTFAHAVGLGDPERIDDAEAITTAVSAAGADTLLSRLPQGLGTQLGRRFGGLELSEGQWQKVALARACVRPEPLLFVLDEPTASLDAPSERDIFGRYTDRARSLAKSRGAITVIVSHRFSTVAGADLILVMHQGRLAESGTHTDLMRLGGLYARLYGIQEQAYAVQSPMPDCARRRSA
ncbi:MULTISPECIES: ABC transporter ATP-binding protein [unclassified Streptomyces]|uniref:ABC transporter ATP-binding protein n=1 Tax=unclassified Streptomyces TaxID=2593676 RepID=UPI002365EA26|nr:MULTISPECIES: ABC transporter ATP-binding protein [unclassified Streptomyces]MDF3139834.1 ABC transporter ATP-binding protein [Streptomyces sp. T21Q-yed]WDF41892.1 ABC transporter ATP-binding protein [Streptomyces sp. T12]